MATVSLLCAVALAGVFAVSGVAKLLDPVGTREAVAGFGVPERAAGPVARSLAPLELVVAVLLVVPATTVAGFIAALLLLAGFTRAVAIAMRAGRRPECHCFGRIGGADVSVRTVVRNLVLAVIAVVGLATRGDWSTLTTGQVLAGVLAGLCLTGLVVAGEWLAGRAARRRRDLEAEQDYDRDSGRAAGDRPPAPDFRLPTLAGPELTRDDVLATDRPTLLVVLSPGCGSCRALRPAVVRWSQAYDDRLHLAVVTHGGPDANRADYADAGELTVLLDESWEMRESYGVRGTPAAVLVGPDLRVGPVARGERLVRRLLVAGLSGSAYRTDPDPPETGAAAESITLASVLAPRPAVSRVERADGVLLVEETTGASVTLDPIGAMVWSVLDGTSPLDEIVADLAEVFGAPRAVVEEDTLRLARGLGRAGLLAGIAAEPPSDEVETPDPAPAAGQRG